MKEIIISENESFQRLDRFLMKLMPHASKGFIQKMIRKKNIKCNNEKSDPCLLLKKGDAIQIYFSDETYGKFTHKAKQRPQDPKIASPRKLAIIAENKDLLVVNKPANLLSQPDYSGDLSLIDLALDYLIATGSYDPQKEITFTPACSNRLDRNTSGIVLIPKTYQSLQTINTLIREKKVKKYYLALVDGIISTSGSCQNFGTKDKFANLSTVSEAKISKDSQLMALNYRPLESHFNTTLIRIELLTGRSHQIRAQLAHLGHPILGDHKYGKAPLNQQLKKTYRISSQLLHADNYIIPALDYNFSAWPPDQFLKLAHELNYHYFSKEAKKNGVLE